MTIILLIQYKTLFYLIICHLKKVVSQAIEQWLMILPYFLLLSNLFEVPKGLSS